MALKFASISSKYLQEWFQPGSVFSRVAKFSDKNILNYFYILYFLYGTTFPHSQNNRITWQKW